MNSAAFLKGASLICLLADNSKDISRPSLALLLACREQLSNLVTVCLDYAADPTVTGDDGLGAIHHAIGTKDVTDDPPETVEIIQLLVKQGAKMSAPDLTDDRLTPLHRAAMTKNVSALKFLLDCDEKIVNIPDGHGNTALWHACTIPNQKPPLVKELIMRGADFAGKPRPELLGHNLQSIKRDLDENGL